MVERKKENVIKMILREYVGFLDVYQSVPMHSLVNVCQDIQDWVVKRSLAVG